MCPSNVCLRAIYTPNAYENIVSMIILFSDSLRKIAKIYKVSIATRIVKIDVVYSQKTQKFKEYRKKSQILENLNFLEVTYTNLDNSSGYINFIYFGTIR